MFKLTGIKKVYHFLLFKSNLAKLVDKYARQNSTIPPLLKRCLYLITCLVLSLYLYDFNEAQSGMFVILDFNETTKNFFEEWKHVLPKKQRAYTHYEVIQDRESSYLAIRSSGTCSWIEKDLNEIDISEYPVMEWSWMVSQFPELEWERDKSDDDFALRIELVYDFKGSALNPLNIIRKGLLTTFFRLSPPELTISYVWALKVPAEEPYVSPSDKRMIVFPIESGTSMRGLWIDEKRNIRDDLNVFKKERHLVLKKIRIRSDTENSSSSVESGLQKLVLRAKNEE